MSLNHLSVLASVHAPLYIALPVIAAVIIAKIAFSRSRGLPAIGGEVVLRCSKGHLFRATWSPLGSFTAVRLGFARFQRCPVGQHWALVRPVSESELTDHDRRTLDHQPD